MARGRIYAIPFRNVAVAAVQDLIAAYCGASMGVALHGFTIGQITGTTVQNLNISVKRLPATVTSGSGGTSVTPQKMGRGDAAATITARANDTTQATTSGTAGVLHGDVFNTVNGYQFFWPPNDQPVIGLSEAAVISLDTPPAAPMTMSGTLIVEELL